ncbi:RNA-DNA hybrid ribonuclease [Sporobolomyces koalae]|uniref:RNA-DNA hybrid ribonuclease n=1 Tax=Sporobolomyces koalae TaxID=500713 RepID=UPI003178C1B0
MAKTTKPGFYAVQAGWQPGVYKTWYQCKAQVDGFKGCKHKKFPTLAEAEAFVQGRTPTESPSRPPASLSFHNEHNKSKSRARPNEQDDEPAAKRLKRPDPVFGTRESQFPAHRIVYSDGSSKGNGKRGAVAGSGVFWSHERGAKNLSERLPGVLQTNNRAEMYAVARILETDPCPEEPLLICTDSKYTIEVFTSYIPGWRKRGWKTSSGTTPLNSDLIKYIISLLALRTTTKSSSDSCMANVKFKWIKGHAGQEGNEMADKLANQGAALPKAQDRDFEALAQENERKLKADKKGKVVTLDEVTWDVESDLLSEAELQEMERKQDF